MRNILLLFAKLNPAIRYVQGMNEVLAPIYYVFSTDPNEQNAVRVTESSRLQKYVICPRMTIFPCLEIV